jgi:hypothetical protein
MTHGTTIEELTPSIDQARNQAARQTPYDCARGSSQLQPSPKEFAIGNIHGLYGDGAIHLATGQHLMQLYTLDPLLDPRWDKLVALHPQSSVFHTSGWLRALARTYGYRPIVLTSAPRGQKLSDGIVFCEIESWITGSRLVSLPFSDHVQPLLSEGGNTLELLKWVQAVRSKFDWKYVELRPVSECKAWGSALGISRTFWLHTISLEPRIEQLYCNLHRDCMRRRIRHAERENLKYERGTSGELVNDFYDLLVMTRKRHGLLPQPQSWFRNLMSDMSPNAEIRLVRKAGNPIAAMLSLRHRGTVVYKYGCSDHRFHCLAGMPLLFWKMIEESKAEGAEQIDLGRSELDNSGLVRFKNRLGSVRTQLNYCRYVQEGMQPSLAATASPAMRALSTKLPAILSTRAGAILYRHFG